MRRVFVLLLSALLLSSVAHAQSAPQEDARTLSQQAKAAFDAGDFVKAAKLLEAAYRLKPWSVFLYNLGRTYQQGGNKAEAVRAYERYLSAEPRSADAGAVRESIRQLKEQMDHDAELEQQAVWAQARAEKETAEARRAKEAAEKAEEEAKLAAEKAKHRPSAWPWIVTGVGLSGVAAGAVFGGLSRGAHNSAVSDPSAAQAQSDQSHAQTLAVTADALFVAGAVVGVVGAVWGVFDLRVALSSGTRAGVVPGGVVVAGTF